MNVFPSAIEEILRQSSGVGEFAITFYNDPHAMDEVKVEAELAQPREARAIQDRLRQRLGLRVRIVPVRAGDPADLHGQGAARPGPPTRGAGMAMAAEPALRRSAPRRSRTRSAPGCSAARWRRATGSAGRRTSRAGSASRRPTLREALRLLSSAHLIRATKGPGGGIFVAATPEQGIGRSVTDSVASMLSADSIDLDELIETRMLLEIPLAGLAAQRATEADVAALRAVLDAAGESRRASRSAGSTRGCTG